MFLMIKFLPHLLFSLDVIISLALPECIINLSHAPWQELKCPLGGLAAPCVGLGRLSHCPQRSAARSEAT